MKRICETLQKPYFEVSQWPVEELEWWAACFSINDNKDKPTVKVPKARVTVSESIDALKRVLHS